jgi:hypothetical protein
MLGAALYRAANYQEARRQLVLAGQMAGSGGSVAGELFLAMTYHRLGDARAAKRCLARATELFASARAPNWTHRLSWQYLGREAEAVLGQKSR